MALQRKSILLLPRDAVLFRNKFGGDAHVKIVIYVPQTVAHHRIHDFRISVPVTGACARQQVRTIRHRFHAARDHDFGFAEHYPLRREAHGLQSRAANFVDRHRRDAHVESRAQARLPRGILSEARLHHVAHDDFVHGLRLDARAAHGFGDGFRAKLRGRKRRKPSLKFSDGRTDCAEDYGLFHGCSPGHESNGVRHRRSGIAMAQYRRELERGQFRTVQAARGWPFALARGSGLILRLR